MDCSLWFQSVHSNNILNLLLILMLGTLNVTFTCIWPYAYCDVISRSHSSLSAYTLLWLLTFSLVSQIEIEGWRTHNGTVNRFVVARQYPSSWKNSAYLLTASRSQVSEWVGRQAGRHADRWNVGGFWNL